MNKAKRYIQYFLVVAVLLFSFFVLGPIIETQLVTNHKPYIVVDKDEYLTALKCQGSAQKSCNLPPVLPIEMKASTIGESIKTIHLPVDVVPVEYLPYIHYPESWNSYWNPYQPNGVGPILRTALNITTPVLAVGTIAYGMWLWRKGKFKKFIEKLKP